MWQTYYAPHSLNEALDLLVEYREEIPRLIAGGTDLIVGIEQGLYAPKIVIDISRIPKLDTITLDAQKRIHLGPLVTHNQVINSKLCVERAFPLVQACWEIGAPQIRNRGTVAGNLVTASPAHDTITPLWALDATVTLQSMRGSRSLTFEEFFKGARQTAIEPDEILVDISFPAMADYQIGTFLKFGLRHTQAVSVVNVAVVLSMFTDIVTRARLTLGSVAPTIVRATDAERFLTGKVMTQEVIARTAALAAQTIMPITDLRGSAEYRRYMAETLMRHALESISHGTEDDAIPRKPIMLWGKTDGHFPIRVNHSTTHSERGNEPIVTTVNGELRTIYGASNKTLLRMLREDLNLTGTKEGCAEGECGACTVFLDGIAVLSCLVPAPRAHQSEIVTIEGLANGDKLHPLQQSFIDEGAVQCGYCTPGFIMSGAALMAERNYPTHDDIKRAVSGNLCRCTGYYKILQAIEKACGLNPLKPKTTPRKA